MRFGFRAQLTASLVAILLVTVALISLLANIFIHKKFVVYVEEQQRNREEDVVAMLVSQYDSLIRGWDLHSIQGIGMAALNDGFLITLLDKEGNVLWDVESHNMVRCRRIMGEIIGRMEEMRLNGGFISQEFDLVQDGQVVGGAVIKSYVPYFLSDNDSYFIRSLNIVLVAIGSLVLLCSLVVGWFLARRISKPVIETTNIATQIAEGNYGIRLKGNQSGIRELDGLVSAVNHMASSLARQEGLRRHLTNDIAHELRTPLSAVASHLEAMIDGLWEPTPKRLQSSYEEVERIAGLIVDLEKLAQVESEVFELNREPLDLLLLARHVVGNFERESAKKQISIELSGESSVVEADKNRMNQVLANLLSNAIKYTPEKGFVHISVRDSWDRGSILIEDNGIGIPKDELPLIFERFYRTDKSRNRKTGGAGLGLSIAKSIVAAHGGTIKAESEAGQGSRFTVSIPKPIINS